MGDNYQIVVTAKIPSLSHLSLCTSPVFQLHLEQDGQAIIVCKVKVKVT